jgi:hypothetical protein
MYVIYFYNYTIILLNYNSIIFLIFFNLKYQSIQSINDSIQKKIFLLLVIFNRNIFFNKS